MIASLYGDKWSLFSFRVRLPPAPSIKTSRLPYRHSALSDNDPTWRAALWPRRSRVKGHLIHFRGSRHTDMAAMCGAGIATPVACSWFIHPGIWNIVFRWCFHLSEKRMSTFIICSMSRGLHVFDDPKVILHSPDAPRTNAPRAILYIHPAHQTRLFIFIRRAKSIFLNFIRRIKSNRLNSSAAPKAIFYFHPAHQGRL